MYCTGSRKWSEKGHFSVYTLALPAGPRAASVLRVLYAMGLVLMKARVESGDNTETRTYCLTRDKVGFFPRDTRLRDPYEVGGVSHMASPSRLRPYQPRE